MHVAPVALVDETPGLDTDWSMVDLPPKELVWREGREEREKKKERKRERERERERFEMLERAYTMYTYM